MVSDMENELIYDGTESNNYYLYVTDYSQTWTCTPTSGNPESIAFTPVYAAYVSEIITPATYGLPEFTAFNYTECSLYAVYSMSAYSDWSNGHGVGVVIDISGTQNTDVGGMTSGNGGQFQESWASSAGT